MDPIHSIADFFRRQQERVQPTEPAQGPRTHYRGQPPETLSPDTIGKPPEPRMTVITFPELASKNDAEITRLLEDKSVRVRIHPDQFSRLLEMVGSERADALRAKFIVDENTGRIIDKLV